MIDGSSRFGLNIREDLGNGYSIRGYLENGFKVDSGEMFSEGQLFNRRAILAVHSDKYGELGIGRMGSVDTIFGPYGQGLAALCPVRTGYGSDFSLDGMFASELPQSSNSITYQSPRVAGFQFAATYSMQMQGQENDQVSKNDRSFGSVLSYVNGPLTLVLGGSTIRWGNLDSDSSKFKNSSEFFAGVVYDPTPTVKLYAAIQRVEAWRQMFYYGWAAGNTNHEGIDGMSYMVAARYQPIADTTLIGSYALFDGNKNTETDAEGKRHRINLGIEYNLSKRTMAYIMGAYHNNEGAIRKDTNVKSYITTLIGIQHWF